MDEGVISIVPSCITKEQVHEETAKDSTLQRVLKYIEGGWPSRKLLTQKLMPFYQLQMELSIVDGTVFREDKVTVPDWLTSKLVSLSHEAHSSIVKTKQSLRDMFW